MNFREPKYHNEPLLAFIRLLPCLVTGQPGVEAAHLRFPSQRYNKRFTGKSERPHDHHCIPLSSEKHREQHDMDEMEFWKQYDIDPIPVAEAIALRFYLKNYSLDHRIQLATGIIENAINGEFPFSIQREYEISQYMADTGRQES